MSDAEPKMKDREARRRAQVLNAVAACVAEEGIEGATMNKIAKRAGVSAGLVAYYYRDKSELIREALRDAHAHFSAQVVDSFGPKAPDWRRIQAWFDTWFPKRAKDAPPWSLWLEFWAHAAREPELRAYQSERFMTGRELFAQHIRAGVEGGELSNDVDPYLIGELFMVLNYGLSVAVSATEAISPQRAAQIAEMVFRLLGAPVGEESLQRAPGNSAADNSRV